MTIFIEGHQLLRESVRAFVHEKVLPVIADYEENEQIPVPLIQDMAKQGFLGAALPEEWGGAGFDTWAYTLLLQELERGSGSLRSMVSVQNSLVGMTLLRYGTQSQKERYLRSLAQGEFLGAYALTESEAGSNPAEMQTHAVRQSERWLLNGQKMFISNATLADVIIVFAKTPSEVKRPAITAFLVDRTFQGVSSTPLKKKLGLRAADTGALHFDDVSIPAENMLGQVGEGFKIAMYALDNGRISVAAAGVGIAQAALDVSIAYARERKQFGKPLGGFQMIQDMIATMHVETEAARGLLEKAIIAKEAGQPYTVAASAAKLYASEVANRNASLALQIHGGYGFFEDYPVARLYRDARVLPIYEGTSQIQRLLIASHLLGIKAFI